MLGPHTFISETVYYKIILKSFDMAKERMVHGGYDFISVREFFHTFVMGNRFNVNISKIIGFANTLVHESSLYLLSLILKTFFPQQDI